MDEMMKKANEYWEKAENKVWKIATANDLDAGLQCAMELTGFDMNSFLFDLFDYGEANPTDEEILAAIIEALS